MSHPPWTRVDSPPSRYQASRQRRADASTVHWRVGHWPWAPARTVARRCDAVRPSDPAPRGDECGGDSASASAPWTLTPYYTKKSERRTDALGNLVSGPGSIRQPANWDAAARLSLAVKVRRPTPAAPRPTRLPSHPHGPVPRRAGHALQWLAGRGQRTARRAPYPLQAVAQELGADEAVVRARVELLRALLPDGQLEGRGGVKLADMVRHAAARRTHLARACGGARRAQ